MRPGRVIGGVLLILVLGVPALLGVLLSAVGGTAWDRSHEVAAGRAPGTLRFAAEDRRYVVALSAPVGGLFDGLSRSERRARLRVRDGEASQARCAVTHPGGRVQRLRGDRQGSSVVAGDVYASVGEFDGRPGGTTTVRCRFSPPRDLLGTATETPLMVHPLNRVARTGLWASLAVLLAAVGLGVLQILRGTVWRHGTPWGGGRGRARRRARGVA